MARHVLPMQHMLSAVPPRRLGGDEVVRRLVDAVKREEDGPRLLDHHRPHAADLLVARVRVQRLLDLGVLVEVERVVDDDLHDVEPVPGFHRAYRKDTSKTPFDLTIADVIASGSYLASRLSDAQK